MSSSEHSASSTLKSARCTLALSPGAHSSCKAVPAAAQSLQDNPPEPEIMIPRMVQPQWPLLATETENSSEGGDSSCRGQFCSQVLSAVKCWWGAPSRISFHPVSLRVKTPVRRLVRVNMSVCIPLARATGNSQALKE